MKKMTEYTLGALVDEREALESKWTDRDGGWKSTTPESVLTRYYQLDAHIEQHTAAGILHPARHKNPYPWG